MKSLVIAAGLAFGAVFAAAPASALPIAKIAGAESTPRAETVAWYCNANGKHCVKAPRAGYVVRPAWEPACAVGWTFNGYTCVAPVVVKPRPIVVAPAPVVVVKPRPVVVVKKPAVVVKIKP
jgi:hypothetical protein